MLKRKMESEKSFAEQLWDYFENKEGLSKRQLEQFQQYYTFLINSNKQFNLTAITSLKRVLMDHFSDSLILKKFMDVKSVKSIADVGPGAGFPLIPLKILFPHLRILLLEVTRKKRVFLQQVVDLLGLEDVEICELDWRTFLRSTEGEIDLFVSRAALDDSELIRLFRQTCSYRKAQLVYWAGELWEPSKKAAPYVDRIEPYQIGAKVHKLVFMKASVDSKDSVVATEK